MVVGVCVGVGVGVGMRVPKVSRTSVGQLVPFCGVNVVSFLGTLLIANVFFFVFFI